MVVLPNSLTDHPSLLGIVRMPKCTYYPREAKIPILQYADATNKWMSYTQPIDLAEWIKGGTSESQSYSVSKSKTTDFYPYTYYVLTDGEVEPLVLQPQYLPSSFTVKGRYALSHQPVERYYPSSYKGSTDGVVYNITNTYQMMLPTGSNEGLQYMVANANTMKAEKQSGWYNVISSGVGTVGGVIGNIASGEIGGAINSGINGAISVGSGIMSIRANNARNKDILTTPSSISSWGTVSTRNSFGTNSVRLIKYTVRDVVKNKIENFVSRYGNKFNSYAVIDHKTYKGYIKMISPDIDTGIDNMYIQKIKFILERGVYIE